MKFQDPYTSNKSVSFKLPQSRSGDLMKGKDIPAVAKRVIQEKLVGINHEIERFQERNEEVKKQIDEAYACENPKLLEAILEHILFHWEEIMEVLIDDLMEEEVCELNKIEEQKGLSPKKKRSTNLADRSVYGKFCDFKSVDVRDI
eukprot:CAMPEP_0170557376 /NCGR_PEP_ID=MMETSP0211-20121228/24676_1 /TAXON_ID=311385 /ORGANISM="Pseudokeronopsis sp., Strain OXSARD2" /LENGTH=145 /DNA_ID=CAMNT_0010868335 /DNA_START=344 /DNA_END=778 /DNA_ORIENTATION=-